MQYRINHKSGEELSALGFGCLRFHKVEAEVERQIRYAIAQGVNFFDTAYIYKGSEATLGRILAKDGLREKVNICTKLPYYMVKKAEDIDRLFNTQLERLQTDYVDYYLIHMLPGLQSWEWLCKMGIREWIADKKAAGKIRQFGFSFPGPADEFTALIDAGVDLWDVCLIQYNYYDENHQAGRQGLLYAVERGVGVMIMEPLRGGTLVDKLPPEAKAMFDAAPGKRTAADWGLRWVLDHPQVFTVLSGMGTMEMVEENVRIASEVTPGQLTEEDFALYAQVKAAIQAATKVTCTGCAYCVPCPQGVDIPLCFGCLNNNALMGRLRSMWWYVATTEGRNASLCNRCGKCEPLCPQGIPIREKVGQTARELERFPYRVLRLAARRMLRNRK